MDDSLSIVSEVLGAVGVLVGEAGRIAGEHVLDTYDSTDQKG